MNTLLSRPLLAVLVLAVSACGGGGELEAGQGGDSGPTAPAKFKSTDDVAAVFTAAEVALTAADGGYGGLNELSAVTAAPSSAKAIGMKRSNAKSAASGSSSKAAEACSQSGTYSYTSNATTLYAYDGMLVASKCVDVYEFEPNAVYSYDGKRVDLCTDSQQTQEDCLAGSVASGENGTPYTLGYKVTGEGAVDLIARLLLTVSGTGTAQAPYTDTSTFNGTIEVIDNLAKQNLQAYFEHLKIVLTYSESSATQNVDGVFGVASNVAKCSIGKVSIKTTSPVVFDSQGGSTSGAMTITDGSAQAAGVQFNSDGSVTVTLNGASKTYSVEQLSALCG